MTLLLLLLACPADDGGIEPIVSAASDCGSHGNLEILPLDIWGRDVDAQVSLDREPTLFSDSDSGAGPGVLTAPLGPTSFEFQVIAGEVDLHHDASIRLAWSGEELELLSVDGHSRWAMGSESRLVNGEACTFHSLYVGLDHTWFAASGAAPSRNRVDLLINGEDFWASVAEDLAGATERVSWSNWWWESDFELLRPSGHASMSENERRQNTVMSRFEDLPGVERRVLINRFWGENTDWTTILNSDAELEAVADRSGDLFEVMLQGNLTEVPLYDPYVGEVDDFSFEERVLANPRYSERNIEWREQRSLDLEFDAASWHQKSVVVDGRVAFVTGMNTKGTDWDGSGHAVFDERRMAFDADNEDREEVITGEARPDFEPRRDYGVRLEGPAVRDVESLFLERWQQGISEGNLYADHATDFSLDEAPKEQGGSLVQISTTMPAPWNERSILEAQIKAISHAQDYIFIDDQYLRAPVINAAIAAQMIAKPGLVLIVVSQALSNYDGGAKYTWLSHALFSELFGDRYLLLQLRSAALYMEEGTLWDTVSLEEQAIFNHSKLRIIDDVYLSVGSCNMNNRGYLYEGELNVEVLNEELVGSARAEIFEQLVGEYWAPYLSSDAGNNLDVLAMAAEDNAQVIAWWEENDFYLDVEEAQEALDSGWWVSGFLYPLDFSPDYWWDVGPDIF